MLDIKVLGTGCAGCFKMEQIVIDVLQTLGVRDANVELVTDERVIEYDLISEQMPGLMINGQLTWGGSVPTKEQVSEWLRHALAAATA